MGGLARCFDRESTKGKATNAHRYDSLFNMRRPGQIHGERAEDEHVSPTMEGDSRWPSREIDPVSLGRATGRKIENTRRRIETKLKQTPSAWKRSYTSKAGKLRTPSITSVLNVTHMHTMYTHRLHNPVCEYCVELRVATRHDMRLLHGAVKCTMIEAPRASGEGWARCT